MKRSNDILFATSQEIRKWFKEAGHDPSSHSLSDMRARLHKLHVGATPTSQRHIRLSKLSRELGADPNDVLQALQNATGDIVERKPNTKLSIEQADAVRECLMNQSEPEGQGQSSEDGQEDGSNGDQGQGDNSPSEELVQDWMKEIMRNSNPESAYEQMERFFEIDNHLKEAVNNRKGKNEAQDDHEENKVEEGKDGNHEQEGLRFDLLEEQNQYSDEDVAQWFADYKNERNEQTEPDQLPF